MSGILGIRPSARPKRRTPGTPRGLRVNACVPILKHHSRSQGHLRKAQQGRKNGPVSRTVARFCTGRWTLDAGPWTLCRHRTASSTLRNTNPSRASLGSISCSAVSVVGLACPMPMTVPNSLASSARAFSARSTA